MSIKKRSKIQILETNISQHFAYKKNAQYWISFSVTIYTSILRFNANFKFKHALKMSNHVPVISPDVHVVNYSIFGPSETVWQHYHMYIIIHFQLSKKKKSYIFFLY